MPQNQENSFFEYMQNVPMPRFLQEAQSITLDRIEVPMPPAPPRRRQERDFAWITVCCLESFLDRRNQIPHHFPTWAARILQSQQHLFFISSFPQKATAQVLQLLHGTGLMIRGVSLRSNADHRPDYLIKKTEIQDTVLSQFNVNYIFDHDDTAISIYRSMGLSVLKVLRPIQVEREAENAISGRGSRRNEEEVLF